MSSDSPANARPDAGPDARPDPEPDARQDGGLLGTARGRRPAGMSGLVLACVGILLAAADTYVIVLALPQMMVGIGLDADQLQRAAPIVSGFLLGYVAMLPLIGRLSDLFGRTPVLVGSLGLFAFGSLVTAGSQNLFEVVVGRFLQGVGGGGLVPATLALVADLWPVERRGLPLGIVGGIQELGSLIGPLFGALVLELADWRAIFWINLGLGAALAVALRLGPGRRGRHADSRAAGAATPGSATAGSATAGSARSGSARSGSATAGSATAGSARSGSARSGSARSGSARSDPAGVSLAVLALAGFVLTLVPPARLTQDVVLGTAFLPFGSSTSRWLTPIGAATALLALGFLARELTAHHPLVRLRALPAVLRSADVTGAVLLGLVLAAVVVAFAVADPEREVLSPAGPWLLAGGAVAALVFGVRERRTATPLVPSRALRCPPAWGSLVVSLLVGAALIAVLVDVPVYARATDYPDSQLGAALVLVQFLVAVPIGAVAGGWLSRRIPAGPLTAGALVLAAGGLAAMSTWGLHASTTIAGTIALVVCGLGFGLAIAPVNAAMLAATPRAAHGVASALLVVARMVGMLIGLSALTAIGLHRFWQRAEHLRTPDELCPAHPSRCPAYTSALREAALTQVHTIFAGAAVCAVVGAAIALALLGFRAVTRSDDGADGSGRTPERTGSRTR